MTLPSLTFIMNLTINLMNGLHHEYVRMEYYFSYSENT